MNIGRSKEFVRDQSLEDVLKELNQSIPGCMSPPYETPQYPVVLIVGAPRSGTTLMLQWLAASGMFAYPSNLIARFYGNPYMGARIQQATLTYDSNRQIFTKEQSLAFSSDLGRTEGALAPSEFWYFWRRFFEFGDTNFLKAEKLAQIDTHAFLTGLAGLEAALSAPIATKGMILNWNLPFLDKVLPHALFINVERDPFYNAQSLLQARERFFGDRKRWYSFKPPEYDLLSNEPPLSQVVGQIYYNRTGVQDGLAAVEKSRKLSIDYSAFCANPKHVMSLIIKKFAEQGFDLEDHYSGPSSFKESRSVRLSQNECAEIESAIANYEFS